MKVLLRFVIIVVTFLSVSINTSAYGIVYDKCPDGADIVWDAWGGISNTEQNEAELLCSNNEIEIYANQNQRLLAIWTHQDSRVPYDGEVVWNGDRRVSINSAKIVAGMRSCRGNLCALHPEVNTNIVISKCFSNSCKLIRIISEEVKGNWDIYQFSFNEYLSESGMYKVKIQSFPEESNDYIEIRLLNLTIGYSLDVIPGALAASIEVVPKETGRGESFSVSSDIICSGGDCGRTRATLLWSKDNVSFYEVPDSESGDGPFYTYASVNPYDCGNLSQSGTDTCTVSWTVRSKFSATLGKYYFRVKADGGYEGVKSRMSKSSALDVVSGDVEIRDASLNPTKIEVGNSTEVSATVECLYHYCGDVNVYLKNSGTTIGDSGNLTTGNTNPAPCTLSAGSDCPISWTVTANTEGVYNELEVSAMVVEDTSKKDSYLLPGLNVASPPPPPVPKGEIWIDNAEVYPSGINVGESATLSADIRCMGEEGAYCGNITAAARLGTDTLPEGSGDLYADANPKDSGDFSCLGNMAYGDSCTVQWTLTGTVANTYTNLNVLAESDNPDVDSNYSDSRVLDVQNPEFQQTPKLVIGAMNNLSNELGTPFSVSATVYCYYGECGSVSAWLEYRRQGGQWETMEASGPISTEQNTQSFSLAEGESRTLSWNVNSSETGSYEIRVVADAASGDVSDSDMVFGAEIYLSSNIEIEILSPAAHSIFSRGEEILLKARVTDNGEPKPGMGVMVSSLLFGQALLDDNGDGTYSSTVSAGRDDADGSYVLTFSAQDKEKMVEINIDSSLGVQLSTDRQEYELSDTVSLSGSVSRKGSGAQATVELSMECGGWSENIGSVDTDSGGSFSYTFPLSDIVPSGTCAVIADASDSNGNSGRGVAQITVRKSEFDIYVVKILSPVSGQTFLEGESFGIEARVMDGATPLEGSEVTCTFQGKEVTLSEEGNGDYFLNTSLNTLSGSVIKPGEYNHTLSCIARKGEFFGRGFTSVRIKPKLLVSLIQPKGNVTETGKSVHFVVSAFYSDGIPLENGSVALEVNGEDIMLNSTGKGIYEGDYTFRSSGDNLLSFVARDNEGYMNVYQATISSIAMVGVNWPGIGMIIAGLSVLLSIGAMKKEMKKKQPDRASLLKDRIKDLQNEKKAVEKAKEDAEMEYYQRKINENEFRRMMEEYERELLEIKARIKEFESELKSAKK